MTEDKESMLINLVRLIGVDQTKLLLYAKGGQRVYIPSSDFIRDEHWLIEAVGRDSAKVIADSYGGSIVILPLGANGLHNRIKSQIKNKIKAGESINKIVSQTGVSYRTISRHRKKLTENKPPQKPICNILQ
jgi:DNA-binding transcriptional ArsR family regulator